jgi:UDP-N-acetyl-alpha-D-muramoyl-L-alanyl-L-glutamate epimerase
VPSHPFQIDQARLTDITIGAATLRYQFDLDGDEDTIQFEYEPEVLGDLFARTDRDRLLSFAASLGLLCFGRYAPVLPRKLDLTAYAPWVPGAVVEAFNRSVGPMWSEHRYQLGRMDYRRPEIVTGPDPLGSRVRLPLFSVAARGPGSLPDVMVATGSGKDSLLCETLTRRAGLPFEAFTYLYDFYGDPEDQREVFGRIRGAEPDVPVNVLVVRDTFDSWLSARMAEHAITDPIEVDGRTKPFRRESGEDFACSLAMVPLQVARGIGTQAYGNERSADFANLTHPDTGEPVCHQWGKSATAERLVSQLYRTLFTGIDRVSLTKAIYDVRIFEALFALAGDLPYLTNSCNHRKPWCRRCEKCLYVFAGFAAFGAHDAPVAAGGGWA